MIPKIIFQTSLYWSSRLRGWTISRIPTVRRDRNARTNAAKVSNLGSNMKITV
jgi:hypothetical protein